ncbi:MAG TPA: hypothetical protein VGN63_22940 [Flavisolibacter sp.]|jgi:hypothetical protein|nr:hypothetical protein [Flavisolibacter sp.]
MQKNISVHITLSNFQLKSFWERTVFGIVLAVFFLLMVYSIDVITMHVKSPSHQASNMVHKADVLHSTALVAGIRNKSLPLATITTSVYEANIHWAIPYIPMSPDELLVKAKPGYRFIVLDMSYQNISPNQEVDMGIVTLTTIIQDECGREYYSEPLAIASLQREYSFPHHEEHYQRMRGLLKPGDVFRTTIIGFEAPVAVNNFVITMEDGGANSHKLHKAIFSVK